MGLAADFKPLRAAESDAAQPRDYATTSSCYAYVKKFAAHAKELLCTVTYIVGV